jgi:rare lipoprotein A
MRGFLAAVLTALVLVGGASLSAEAAPLGDLRSAGAHRTTAGAPTVTLARAGYDDEWRPSRRARGDARHWKRHPGYAKQHRHARRHATHSKRWSRSASRQVRRGRVASGRRGTRHAMRSGRIPVRAYPVQRLPIGADIVGLASYYWQGQRTATGAWFNPNGMTAAHRTLPFGTKVRVTHLRSGRSVVVTINDRGPYIGGRIIDLSKGAAGVLGMQGEGVARVRVSVLGR